MLDIFRDCFQNPDEEQIWVFGVGMFDQLLWREKLGLLVKVGRLALRGKGDACEWGMLEKAACYSVYQHIYQQMEIEQDIFIMESRSHGSGVWDEDGPEQQLALDEYRSWTQLIESAFSSDAREQGIDEDEIREQLHFDDEDSLDHYWMIIDKLSDRLIGDRDFELADQMLDADPASALEVKEKLGIGNDDYIATVEELSMAQAEDAFDELAQMSNASLLFRRDQQS
ncbi:hypothetical protein CGZ80_18045 [Rhodopirellula sp. MGV]|nr:hypothetical protein CGZ80_18045 [Rhodopirellula sp. MGV]